MDSIKNILDGLIDCGGVFGSNRSLNNAGSSDILANDSLQILGFPKGILKPEFEIPVK